MILLAQMKFRKSLTKEQVKKIKFPMRGFPFTNYISMIFLACIIVVMCLNKDTLVAVIIGPLWLIILVAYYYGSGLHKKPNANAKGSNKETAA